ncbi:MAG: DNA polymerase III subunit delta' [Deltaproteobacteria bacterium]|nr:DNA polymerase III subunit delta' [Deltaproteobacteria bacterium]
MITLKEILGQEQGVSQIGRALAGETLPNAYLFAGPAGVGKKTTAIALAAALNCDEEQKKGCGHCSSCHKIATLQHPDLHVVAPEGKVYKLQQIKDFQRFLKYAPLEGRRHLVILEEGEQLGHHVSNALLKMMEEPSSPTLFILLATQPEELLPTILSRCQIVHFKPLSEEIIKTILLRNGGEKEQVGIASKLGLGSVERALKYLDPLFLDLRKSLYMALHAIEQHEAWQPLACLTLAEQLEKEKKSELLFDLFELWYRDLFFLSLKSEQYELLNFDFQTSLEAISPRYHPKKAAERLLFLSKMRNYFDKISLNHRLAWEYLLLQLRPQNTALEYPLEDPAALLSPMQNRI